MKNIYLNKRKIALVKAITNGCSEKWILRLWSRFIKARDQNSCLSCGSSERIQAHHIIRRTLYPWGAFETGNGITLCLECHKEIHKKSNTRVDFSQLIGEGDDQDIWAQLFRQLWESAISQQFDGNEFYSIEDHMLKFFFRLQGYEHLYRAVMTNKISHVEYAYKIFRVMPESFHENGTTKLIRLNF